MLSRRSGRPAVLPRAYCQALRFSAHSLHVLKFISSGCTTFIRINPARPAKCKPKTTLDPQFLLCRTGTNTSCNVPSPPTVMMPSYSSKLSSLRSPSLRPPAVASVLPVATPSPRPSPLLPAALIASASSRGREDITSVIFDMACSSIGLGSLVGTRLVGNENDMGRVSALPRRRTKVPGKIRARVCNIFWSTEQAILFSLPHFSAVCRWAPETRHFERET